MPLTDRKKFLVLAREDLSGWVEGRALRNNDAKSISKFLFEDIICRHGLPDEFVSDGSPENQGIIRDLL